MKTLHAAKRATYAPQLYIVRYRSTAQAPVAEPAVIAPVLGKTNVIPPVGTPVRGRKKDVPPLGLMPTSVLLRSLAFTTIMSTALLKPAMWFMGLMANHDARLFSPDKNPIMRFGLRSTFYKQFCAGENEAEVGKTIRQLKNQGFIGIILGYAREVVIDAKGRQPEPVDSPTAAELQEIEAWKEGTIRTLRMIEAGDFLAVKYTGAGRIAVDACLQGMPLPPKPIMDAMDEICEVARAQGSRIWIDAEQTFLQPTLDLWVIDLMRRHNTDGVPLVYNTVQAYLKSSRANIINHLTRASREGWTLGIKLVRGAYIANEPRSMIHDTKEETDNNYNHIVKSLLTREFPAPSSEPFPSMQLFVASHNVTSIQKAYTLHSQRTRDGLPTIPVEYGQLQGMADDLSCELLSWRHRDLDSPDELVQMSAPKPFKCLSWGTPTELVQNLYRRAVENTDAIQRTKNMAQALRKELWRRITGGVSS